MSLDLDWDQLDGPLAASIVSMLNRTLEHVERPSFIGPVQILSFDFGSVPPDVELVDMRDVYRDFLEDDPESDDDGGDHHGAGGASVGNGPRNGLHRSLTDPPRRPYEHEPTELGLDDEEYEWVSRRRGARSPDNGSPAYHALPPHVRYGGGARPPDLFSSVPGLRSPPREGPWGTSTTSLGMLSPPLYRSTFALNPLAALGAPLAFPNAGMMPTPRSTGPPSIASPPSPTPQTRSVSPQPLVRDKAKDGGAAKSAANGAPESMTDGASPHPDLQLHLRIHWPSNLRLTITTSLMINVPAPAFLALPIKLTVTGLLFTGELVVAYEGSRRRVHVCVVDELDPYCPLSSGGGGNSANGGTPNSSLSGISRMPTFSSSDEQSPEEEEAPSAAVVGGEAYGSGGRGYGASKPPRVGERVLPRVMIESEIGQTDKHVLRNVKRVEQFVQDIVRDTLENELVFPNFHTIVLG